MRTRREQVQAYQFVIRRIVSALLSGEPEASEQPMRRLRLSLLASTMVAAIVLAAAGIFGLLTNQSSPLEPNTLVIEEGTRATYVYLDDRLHPVVNYASARLILGEANPNERSMPQEALEDILRGPTVGILNAPVSLPEPDLLVGLPWRVCSVPPETSSAEPTTTAVIGDDLAGGSPLSDRGLYVADENEDYLLWNDRRLVVRGPSARTVLGLATTLPVPVATQLVNTVIAGPDVVVPRVPGAGGRSNFRIDGQEATVGRVFRAAGQYYVLTNEGLVPVGEIAAQLRLAGDLQTQEISAEAAGRLLAPEGQRLEPPGFPQAAPEMYAVAESPVICAVYGGEGEAENELATTVEVFGTVPDELVLPAPQPVVGTQDDEMEGVAPVDRVLTEGSKGALVQADPATYLITAEGIRYPLAEGAVEALGYGQVTPVPIPPALVEMIPLGPTLDPQAAGPPVTGGGDADQRTDAGGG